MSTSAIVVLVIAALVLLAAVGWILYRQRRRKTLRARFGPEYGYAVQQYGDEAHAQNALDARTRRLEKVHIRSLTRDEHIRFVQRWQDVQRDFVDDPAESIRRADSLVSELMSARGYPMANFEHRAEDVSVDHPHVVQNFRAAHAIAERHQLGEAGTEDLRQALVYYRNLFDELLEAHTVGERRIKE